MTKISASMVRDLRERTGAGMMSCKKALSEVGGDIDKAIKFLREKGLANASKKAGRIASEGVVYSYIHAGGKIGVLVEINCETDFTAKNARFLAFCQDVAMHIAAVKPLVVSEDDIPSDLIETEREIYANQAAQSGKPAAVVGRIVEGKIAKYKRGIALLSQPFVKDTDKTILDLISSEISVIGEKISVRRFVCYTLGEGLEKKVENFAEEVANITG